MRHLLLLIRQLPDTTMLLTAIRGACLPNRPDFNA